MGPCNKILWLQLSAITPVLFFRTSNALTNKSNLSSELVAGLALHVAEVGPPSSSPQVPLRAFRDGESYKTRWQRSVAWMFWGWMSHVEGIPVKNETVSFIVHIVKKHEVKSQQYHSDVLGIDGLNESNPTIGGVPITIIGWDGCLPFGKPSWGITVGQQ